ADGKVDRSWALDSLAAFARAQIHGRALPRMTWKHDDADGRARVTASCSAPPSAARLWYADAPTRDFRKEKWQERPATIAGDTVSASIEAQADGCRAFFVEIDYTLDGITCRLCTQVRVVQREK